MPCAASIRSSLSISGRSTGSTSAQPVNISLSSTVSRCRACGWPVGSRLDVAGATGRTVATFPERMGPGGHAPAFRSAALWTSPHGGSSPRTTPTRQVPDRPDRRGSRVVFLETASASIFRLHGSAALVEESMASPNLPSLELRHDVGVELCTGHVSLVLALKIGRYYISRTHGRGYNAANYGSYISFIWEISKERRLGGLFQRKA